MPHSVSKWGAGMSILGLPPDSTNHQVVYSVQKHGRNIGTYIPSLWLGMLLSEYYQSWGGSMHMGTSSLHGYLLKSQ